MATKIELYELAFIYWHRHFRNGEKVSIPSVMTKTELTKILKNITPEEFDIADEWISDRVELSSYLESYSPNELKTMLEMKYRMSFPFPLSFLPASKARRLLLSWFKYVLSLKEYDLEPLRNPRQFNHDQRMVFEEIDNAPGGDEETKIVVVNAGPGTGKTTTANNLAIQHIEEGVLLISYTNESIKENYRRLHEYPGTYGKIGSGSNSKKWEKNITVVTVDSLAARINETTTETEHDRAIRLAISNLNYDKFYHPTRETFYRHVIVDECQDIDSLRGELILKFCETVHAKTLTLFGDPRQRIRGNCGEWYVKLWTTKGNPNIVQIPLTISYRFDSNQKILQIVNRLSSRRPNLHVELKPYHKNHRRENIIGVTNIDLLVNAIKESDNFGQWAVIGPTVDRNNKTSIAAHYIATVFRANGIRCYFKSEGAFIADSVAFLTIHSSKGREFDNVIMFGMSGFPKTFPMIPPDEAESLIYVAHSRAKRRIWYIISGEESYILPKGIEESDLSFDESERAVDLKQQSITVDDLFKAVQEESKPHFSVTELLEDHNFVKFMNVNRFSANVGNTIDIPEWIPPIRPSYISRQLWGILLALRFQTLLFPDTLLQMFNSILRDDYIVKSKAQIVADKAKGKVIFGRDRDSNKLIIDSQPDVVIISLLRKICRKSFETITQDDWEFIARCYSSYICGNETEIVVYYTRDDNEGFLPSYSQSFIDVIKGGAVEVPLTTEKYFHGQVDYVDPEGNIYEFKTCGSGFKSSTFTTSPRNIMQAWLYFVMLYAGTNNMDLNKSVFLVSLTEGKIYEINSTRNVESWRYALRSYHLLYYHNTLVQQRRSFLIERGLYIEKDIPEKSYSVDTEFHMGSKEVFEIGMVNVHDIFSTFIDTPHPKLKAAFDFGLEWTKLPRRCFETTTASLPLRFKMVESVVLPQTPPTLYHYLADADVIWYTANHKAEVVDLGSRARIEALKHGMFEAGAMPPRLGELYTLLALVPLETQTHLTAHIALADALMLYELLILGLI